MRQPRGAVARRNRGVDTPREQGYCMLRCVLSISSTGYPRLEIPSSDFSHQFKILTNGQHRYVFAS